jgi:hypothetical protein
VADRQVHTVLHPGSGGAAAVGAVAHENYGTATRIWVGGSELQGLSRRAVGNSAA